MIIHHHGLIDQFGQYQSLRLIRALKKYNHNSNHEEYNSHSIWRYVIWFVARFLLRCLAPKKICIRRNQLEQKTIRYYMDSFRIESIEWLVQLVHLWIHYPTIIWTNTDILCYKTIANLIEVTWWLQR